jgi:ClpX C4-type zinc finger
MPDEKVCCSFCGHDGRQTPQLIKGNDACICRECVVKGIDLLTNNKAKRLSVKKIYLASEIGRKCSLCSRKLADVRAETSINGGKNHVCDECLMVCFDIMLRLIFGKRRPSDDAYTFLLHKLP